MKRGEYEKARACFLETLRLSFTYNSLLFFADSLELIGALFAFRDQTEKGAALLGMADACRVDLEAPTPPRNRPYVEHAMEIVQEKLGAASFRQAFEEGRGLSSEEAVRLAEF